MGGQHLVSALPTPAFAHMCTRVCVHAYTHMRIHNKAEDRHVNSDCIMSLLMEIDPFSVSPQVFSGLPHEPGTSQDRCDGKGGRGELFLLRTFAWTRSIHRLVRNACSQVPLTPPESEFLPVRFRKLCFNKLSR